MATKTTKTTKTEKVAVAKASVKFEVEVMDYLPKDMEEIYVVGNSTKLGAWNPAKAYALKKNAKGLYTGTKSFELGENLEFKIIRTKDWNHVQLGTICEEVENIKVTALEKTVTKAVVYNWKEE